MLTVRISRTSVAVVSALLLVAIGTVLTRANNTTYPTKSYTFTSGQVIKSSEVNTDFDALYSELAGNVGTANILDASITTGKFVDSSVTTAKILDANVTNAKLSGTPNFAVTTDKITPTAITTALLSNGAVTGPKLATQSVSFTAAGPTLLVAGGYANLRVYPNSGAATTKIDVTADYVSVTNGTTHMVVPAVTGTIDTATTGANGLDTGSRTANRTYHVWLIAKADTTSALLASLSSTAPTLPTGYTYKRRIGSFRSGNSNTIIDFYQAGAVTRFYAAQPLAANVDPGSCSPTPGGIVYCGNSDGQDVPDTAVSVYFRAGMGNATGSGVYTVGFGLNGKTTYFNWLTYCVVGSLSSTTCFDIPTLPGGTAIVVCRSVSTVALWLDILGYTDSF